MNFDRIGSKMVLKETGKHFNKIILSSIRLFEKKFI